MHRPAPDHYVTVWTASEPFKAFVPAPVPPLQLVADGVLREPMLYPSVHFKTHSALYYELSRWMRQCPAAQRNRYASI